MSKEVREIHIPNLKQLIKEHADNDAIFETLDYCIQALTPPSIDDITKILVEIYEQNVKFENNNFYFRTVENKLYLIDISLAVSTLIKCKLWVKAHKIIQFFMNEGE